MNLVNDSWKPGHGKRPYDYYYDGENILSAYKMAHDEMCRLLKADVIVQVYEQTNTKAIFEHYICSMNRMLRIINRYIPDDDGLQVLYRLMNNVVVQHYVVDNISFWRV
jgi:hypothetical protein